MKSIEIKYATRVLGPPSSWEGEHECDSLAIRDRGDMMQSAWRPSIKEIALMIAGGVIVLSVWGDAHPPVAITVEEP